MIYSGAERSTQSSCQESVIFLGKCCVVPEEGLSYKNPATGLWLREKPYPRFPDGQLRESLGERAEAPEKAPPTFPRAERRPPAPLTCGNIAKIDAPSRSPPRPPNMKVQLLVSAAILLVAVPAGRDCRPLLGKGLAGGPRQPLDFLQQPPSQLQLQQQLQQLQQLQQQQPVLLRMGEEYFLRLGHLNRSPAAPSFSPGSTSRFAPDTSAANFFLAAVPQLQQLPPRPPVTPQGAAQQEAMEREKRSEEPPISLDLTFHLLREVLEMARDEQLAQQAHSNRKLLESIGK
ncbi:corticoliberin [Ornithorhynchus anatinus]|uniref:Corticoliberin n=1 Tax=Ornithorhynchus anatinus TaxID=9258 RepID=F7AJN6_ORNAN|nr:corticoliberin [Ornithorhynchus anatinus]XP_007665178.1 corticoliberin [Ornithorhynchus anatinus]XP_007665185.1 corticoliberin [Ornithorhynchus anatinus]